MIQRTETEMTALLSQIAEQIGSLDQWSDQALEAFNSWLTQTGDAVTHEWVKRDAETEADC